MRNPSTSVPPQSMAPHQLSMALESMQLQLMSTSERAVALARLASLLMLAAGVVPAGERDDDKR